MSQTEDESIFPTLVELWSSLIQTLPFYLRTVFTNNISFISEMWKDGRCVPARSMLIFMPTLSIFTSSKLARFAAG